MSAPKETVALSGSALDFARSLVEAGEYADLDAAVSGVLDRVREDRAAEWKLIEEEVLRRIELPKDQYVRIESATYFSDRFKAKHGLGEETM